MKPSFLNPTAKSFKEPPIYSPQKDSLNNVNTSSANNNNNHSSTISTSNHARDGGFQIPMGRPVTAQVSSSRNSNNVTPSKTLNHVPNIMTLINNNNSSSNHNNKNSRNIGNS